MTINEVTAIPTHLSQGRFSEFNNEDAVIQDIISVQGRMRTNMLKIKQIHELRMANVMETPLANLKASKAHAEKLLADALPFVDRQREKTRAAAAGLCKTIDDSLEDGALKWSFARETRQHVCSLPKDKREDFVANALTSGNVLAAAAVLGVPVHLSGLSESAHGLYLHRYKQEAHPEQVARIKSLTEAQDILDAGGSAMLSEIHELFDSVELVAAESHADVLRKAEAS